MNNTPTPRTDFAIKASNGQWSYVLKLCAEELERELTAVTEQLKAEQEELTKSCMRERLADEDRKHVENQRDDAFFQLAEEQEKLAAVTEQLKAAQDGWHDEITKGLSELRRAESIYTQAQERAERAEEQRDRLAEAIRKHKFCDVELYEALQSLNQPTP